MDAKSRGVEGLARVGREILDDEEIADVSLATFYVFDKEAAGTCRLSLRQAGGCVAPARNYEIGCLRQAGGCDAPARHYEIGSSGLFHRQT